VTIAALAIASLVVLAYLILAVIAIRHPLLARIAYRQVARRPWQSALMVAGMTFGCAAILGMATLGDSIDGTLSQFLLDRWGNVDLMVTGGGEPFSPDLASRLREESTVSSHVAGLSGGLDLAGSIGDLNRSLGVSTVQLIGIDQATGGSIGAFLLTDGSKLDPARLSAGEGVLTEQLAERLQAQAGDRLTVQIGRPGTTAAAVDLELKGIARRGPGAAYGRLPALFLPLTDLQQLSGVAGINSVRIRVRGQGMAEVQAAHEAAPLIRNALASLPGGAGLELREVKANDLKDNANQTASARPVLIGLGFLVVLAAVALVVNLLLALAEERRPRLAVFRALGLSRTGMVMMSLVEAAFYGLAGSVLGVIPGLAYGAYETVFKPLPAVSFTQTSVPTLLFKVAPASFVFAIGCGILVSLVTVLLTSLRTSRMTISSAIKDLPDVTAERRSWWRRAWIAFLGLAAALCIAAPFVLLRAIGGSVLIIAATAAVRGRLPERARATLAGAALTTWSISLTLLRVDDANLHLGLVGIGLVGGVWGVALLVSANLRLLERLAAASSVRLGATLRPPLAHLTRQPIRTALTTGTLGLTLAMITVFAIIRGSLLPDYSSFTNSWDVVVTSASDPSLTTPPLIQPRIAKQVAVMTATYVGPTKSGGPNGASSEWLQGYLVFLALSDEQFDHPPIRLERRASGYSSDAQVWQAVRDDPNLAISLYATPGESLFVGGQAKPVKFNFAGSSNSPILQPQWGNWHIVSLRGLQRIKATGLGTTLLLQVTPGTDPASIAIDVRRALYSQGVDAVTTRHLYAEIIASGNWYWSLFTDLFDAAIVVGVLSLAILALRAVVDRRRSIGVLRAIGYQPPIVLAAFVVEGLLAVGIGVGAGVAVGLAAGYGLIVMDPLVRQTQFRIAPNMVIVPAALVVAAVLIGVIGPALRASRIPPAEALRHVD